MRRWTLPRRAVLRILLGVVVATAPLVRASPAAAAPAAPAAPTVAAVVDGSGTAKLWRWVALPNTGGLQIHCTDITGRTDGSVKVRWTFDAAGVVTVTADFAAPVTVTGVVTPGGQWLAMTPGYGLSVRLAP